jgi:hypothetical protein
MVAPQQNPVGNKQSGHFNRKKTINHLDSLKKAIA